MITNNYLIMFLLFSFDNLSYYSSKYLTKDNNFILDPNGRWFFIHSLGNFCIASASIPDLRNILMYPDYVLTTQWTEYSYFVFKFSIALHIYHVLFFKLKMHDMIHHILMCVIAGSLEFRRKSIITSGALFFISGLPGGIDYFLLYLVKIKKLSVFREKKLNVYLNIWLRSPGCVLISYLGIKNIYKLYINHHYNLLESILTFLSCALTFWNGQYYMSVVCKSYGKKLGQELARIQNL